MSQQARAWLLAVPLMLAGVESGHWLAYRIAYPDAYLRAQALAGSGHGYLDRAPLLVAIALTIGLCAVGARVVRRADGAPGSAQVSLLPFVLLSPVAFALQELTERLLAGMWPFTAVLAPTFMPGLLFQLPFACAAFVIARWLLRTADRLHVLLFGAGTRRLPPAARALTRPSVRDLPRTVSLVAARRERGPPHPAA
ncbi:MAG TPA: hypothetical protein VG652_10180 [Gaiellaceae bacterium]|nr:hypothetical protein [Gaiellaceae bacterium]